ncbi:hypothetical protein F504_4424 (plasmid) [Ralstonia pseudosolanacearum FQY_4]|nr:hypothetical protein F504_4424 [Ralstonia pseudosolanacearum FQY_4]
MAPAAHAEAPRRLPDQRPHQRRPEVPRHRWRKKETGTAQA